MYMNEGKWLCMFIECYFSLSEPLRITEICFTVMRIECGQLVLFDLDSHLVGFLHEGQVVLGGHHPQRVSLDSLVGGLGVVGIDL